MPPEVFAAALESWPKEKDGAPQHPRAWLFRAARNQAVDHLRRHIRNREKHGEMQALAEMLADGGPHDEAERSLPDERLRLIFTCCRRHRRTCCAASAGGAAEMGRTSMEPMRAAGMRAAMDARVRAASGRPADLSAARTSLEAALTEAEKAGYIPEQLEIGLTLAEVQMRSGQATAAHDRLRRLVRRAAALGFGLIARKAGLAGR